MIAPEVLLSAYRQGVFPMAENGEIQWYMPRQRGLIPLDARFHVPHGLKRALKKRRYNIYWNRSFREVLLGCAARDETWIDASIIESYVRLHELGYAHSVECWDDEGLQGGLYGVALGRAFFGESMFSRKTDTSKVALVALVERLRVCGFELLDSQWMTDHLRTFGGYEVSAREYQRLLQQALEVGGASCPELNKTIV